MSLYLYSSSDGNYEEKKNIYFHLTSNSLKRFSLMHVITQGEVKPLQTAGLYLKQFTVKQEPHLSANHVQFNLAELINTKDLF